MFHKKRKDWIEETVTAAGEHHGLRVIIRNMPSLRDPTTGRRGFAYPDFGSEFRRRFDEAIGHEPYLGPILSGPSKRRPSDAMAALEAGGVLRGTVVLRRGDQIQIEVVGWPVDAPRVSFNRRLQFDSDLSNAIVAAFESVQLKP